MVSRRRSGAAQFESRLPVLYLGWHFAFDCGIVRDGRRLRFSSVAGVVRAFQRSEKSCVDASKRCDFMHLENRRNADCGRAVRNAGLIPRKFEKIQRTVRGGRLRD